MTSYQEFFAELKRRKVFKVTAVYGAGAFIILQAADILGQGLRLPESFLPFITAVVLLGFPLALILAWAFEVTPEGVQRTTAPAAGEIEGMVAAPASQRWPAGLMALAGVAALVAGAWWVGRQGAPASASAPDSDTAADVQLAFVDPSDDPRPSIAVLPFADMSREGDQEYFSDGITEEILNTLARINGLRVGARTSAFAYKGVQRDLREVGQELGVAYLLEGSVRKDGDLLRITAQLIDVASDSHLWSDSYNRTLDNIFEVQTDIAESIAEALTVPLGLDDASDLVQPVADFEAYDLYLGARARMRERGAALTEAIELYRAAIAIDSTWAPAWAGLAEATELRLWHEENFDGVHPDTATIRLGLQEAERAARKALTLDPDNASAHVALGSVLRDRFEWAAAEGSFRRALALDPDNAEAHQQYSELLYAMGRVNVAVVEASRAAALDPAPVRYNLLGFLLWGDDRAAEAEETLLLGYALEPERVRLALSRLALMQGRFDDAYEFSDGISDSPGGWTWPERLSWLREGNLNAIPDTLRQHLNAFDWMLLGEPDSAAAELVRPQVSDFEIRVLYAAWLPIFDSIRSRPLIREYLAQAGLPGVNIQRTPVERRVRPAVLGPEATP